MYCTSYQKQNVVVLWLCVLWQDVIVGGSTGVTLGEEASATFYIQNDGALDVEYEIKHSSEVSCC